MANLTIWWGPGSVMDSNESALPALPLPGAMEASAETIVNPASSTASSPIDVPDLDIEVVPVILTADGGDVWVTSGNTASAGGAQCVLVKSGTSIAAGVLAGTTIKAING